MICTDNLVVGRPRSVNVEQMLRQFVVLAHWDLDPPGSTPTGTLTGIPVSLRAREKTAVARSARSSSISDAAYLAVMLPDWLAPVLGQVRKTQGKR